MVHKEQTGMKLTVMKKYFKLKKELFQNRVKPRSTRKIRSNKVDRNAKQR